MRLVELDDGDVLVRRMDVVTRIADSARDYSDASEGGLLLEKISGRYIINSDARAIWQLVDGQRSVHAIASEAATSVGLSPDDALPVVREICGRLAGLELVERRDPARSEG